MEVVNQFRSGALDEFGRCGHNYYSSCAFEGGEAHSPPLLEEAAHFFVSALSCTAGEMKAAGIAPDFCCFQFLRRSTTPVMLVMGGSDDVFEYSGLVLGAIAGSPVYSPGPISTAGWLQVHQLILINVDLCADGLTWYKCAGLRLVRCRSKNNAGRRAAAAVRWPAPFLCQ